MNKKLFGVFVLLPSIALISVNVGSHGNSIIDYWSDYKGWPMSFIYPLSFVVIATLPLARRIKSGAYSRLQLRLTQPKIVLRETLKVSSVAALAVTTQAVIFGIVAFYLGKPSSAIVSDGPINFIASNTFTVCGLPPEPTAGQEAFWALVYLLNLALHAALWSSIAAMACLLANGSLASMVAPFFTMMIISNWLLALKLVNANFNHYFTFDQCNPYGLYSEGSVSGPVTYLLFEFAGGSLLALALWRKARVNKLRF